MSSILSQVGAAVGGHQTTRIGYEVQGLGGPFGLSATVRADRPDYSSVLVRNRGGIETPLSAQYPGLTELSAEAKGLYLSGPRRATLSYTGNLNPSPYFTQTLTAAYQHGFYNQSTILGVNAAYMTQNQPESWFIDTDFRNRARPALIHANEVVLFVNQILTDRWKAELSVVSAERVEDRPRNVGVTMTHWYALADRLFLKGLLDYRTELRALPLKDERGYFSAKTAEIALTVEPVYDLLATASYAIVVENESDPRTGREAQVGSDQLGLGVSYLIGRWLVNVQGAYRLTNIGLKAYSIGGGVTWTL